MGTGLSEALDRATAYFGDRPAMVDGPFRWTYRQLGEYVDSFNAALDGLDIAPGAVVGVLAKNSRAHLVGWLGVPRGGRVLNELNTRLSVAELAFIVDDSSCRALIVDDEFLATGRELRTSCPTLESLLYAGTGECPSDCVPFDEMIAGGRRPAPVRIDGADTAGIFYTGGTTGRPKGVMLSHDNLLANAKHALICLGYSDRDTYLHSGPMFHLADGASTIALTWVGGTHVIVPGFDPETWAITVTRERVTRAMLVPTMLAMLLAEPLPADTDLSSLRSVLYGASPMPEALLRAAMTTLDCDWCQVYGMTEASPIVSFLDYEDHRRAVLSGDPEATRRLGSVGRPIVGVQVRIQAEDGSARGPGEIGEIVVRGSNIMAGYLNRPEETAEVLVDGWYHTGDAGYLDAAGYLYVVDRLKDMIITGGENVYSTEVENALYRHTDVLEAAVFGVPDDRWGEVVHAAVVLRAAATISPEALREHTRGLLAGYKAPRVIHIVDVLPKSGAGKILKRNLRERYTPVRG
ncbi:long-chain-fatty-acid--CoA ligase [Mycolicibacterium thermoresistibile]